MEKRIIGVYRIEYRDLEIGYARVELNDSFTYLARTKLNGEYSSYVHAVCDDAKGYAVLPDGTDMILVDAYSVYSL